MHFSQKLSNKNKQRVYVYVRCVQICTQKINSSSIPLYSYPTRIFFSLIWPWSKVFQIVQYILSQNCVFCDTNFFFVLGPWSKQSMVRGHSTITWTKFWPLLTPSPLEWTSADILQPPPLVHVDKRGKPPPLKYQNLSILISMKHNNTHLSTMI